MLADISSVGVGYVGLVIEFPSLSSPFCISVSVYCASNSSRAVSKAVISVGK